VRRGVLQTLFVLAVAGALHADALVVTRAMKSTTIAEVFVEDGSVRAELEVGLADLRAFAAYLPARLRDDPTAREALKLPETPEPSWRILVNGSEIKPSSAVSKLRKRVLRDPITGEQEGESDELIVLLSFEYPITQRPKTLTLQSPPGAQIGFVLYDGGLPVNDFRYLPRTATVDLDENDPWYSRFRHSNLRRRFDSPLSAYIYVEPYEIRKEIVVRPRDLQQWIDLGLEGRDVLPIEEQEAVMQKAAIFLQHRAPVHVDGKPAEFKLDRVHFIRRTLRRTGVIDPPEPLSLTSATLGVIFVHARAAALPEKVSMRWDLFGPRIQSVPAVATDQAGGMPSQLTPEDDVLVWTNFIKNPAPTGFVAVPSPGGTGSGLLWVSIVLAGLAAWTLFRRRFALAAVLLVVATGLLFVLPSLRSDTDTDTDSEAVVSALLRNTYRAFDFVGESAVYDALQRSVDGEVLQDAYLQTRRALEIRNQGGARVKVKEVTLESCRVEPVEEGFRARCVWTVDGSVGHWGHVHQRRNRYEADLTFASRDGGWKIVGLEMLDEARAE